MTVKQFFRRILLGKKSNSDTYIAYLRTLGMKIGEGTVIFSPNHSFIDDTRPFLIDIGNNVQITRGVTILTHGYDWAVLKTVYGEVLGSSGKVHIGNNVFIGMNTTILKGVHVGNNVIIGAGSLVNRNIPDNCVVVGNPAKVVMTLDEYYKKRKAEQLYEASELVSEYRSMFKANPTEDVMSEFFWLFTDGEDKITDSWNTKMKLVGNYEQSMTKLKFNKKLFSNMESFLDSIK